VSSGPTVTFLCFIVTAEATIKQSTGTPFVSHRTWNRYYPYQNSIIAGVKRKRRGKVATSYRYAIFIVVYQHSTAVLIQQFVCLSGSHTLALYYNTQLSQRDRATLCVSRNLVNCCKITSEKACNRRTTLKVTQGHRKWRCSIGHMSLPISGL